jgi:hypothetical protein
MRIILRMLDYLKYVRMVVRSGLVADSKFVDPSPSSPIRLLEKGNICRTVEITVGAFTGTVEVSSVEEGAARETIDVLPVGEIVTIRVIAGIELVLLLTVVAAGSAIAGAVGNTG